MLKRSLLTLLLIACGNQVAIAEDNGTISPAWADYDITPVHPIGYRPSKDSDEGGLWMISDSYEEATKSSPFLVRDEALNRQVKEIVCRIAGEYCSDIRVYILRNAYFNASMFPNGMMHIWTGLLLRVQNEAQLATVIGHEIAHYLRNHSLQQWQSTRSQAGAAAWVSLVSAGAGVGFVGDLFTLGVLANIMSYSRSHESEADAYGLKLIADAGYDPRAASLVWDYIERENNSAEYQRKGSIFSNSHPSPVGRKTELTKLAQDLITKENQQIVDELRYRRMLAEHYPDLLSAEINQQLHGRSETLLKELEENDIGPVGIDYFWALFYRTRKNEGDEELAIEHYKKVIDQRRAPPEAYRDLGYMMLKKKDNVTANQYFTSYLEMAPDASDREMIEFYLHRDQ